MRAILLALSAILFYSPAALAEVTWSGGVGIRHMVRHLDDGLQTRSFVNNTDMSVTTNKRWEYRGALSLLSKTESVDFGLDLRTVSGVTSEWVTSTLASSGLGIGVAQAFGRLRGEVLGGKGAVTLGRQRTVILYDNMAQMLFDNDVRFDGLGWAWKYDFFGINISQYVLGATEQGTGASASTYTYTAYSQENASTRSHFGVLYQFQPFVEFKLGEEIKSLFAVGYHNWSGTGAKFNTGWYNNAVHGGTAGTVGNIDALPMDNAQQWQFFSDTSLPWNLRFVAEYIFNKRVNYGLRIAPTTTKADGDALALSLAWGKPKKAGEFGLSYSFSDKGLGSVISTFTNGDIAADNQSHFFEGKYMLTDGFQLASKAQFHKEKARLGGDGQPLTSPNERRNQTQKRFEFIGSLQF